MKYVKKLCLILSLLMLISAFAACTPEQTDTEGTSENNIEQTVEAPVSESTSATDTETTAGESETTSNEISTTETSEPMTSKPETTAEDTTLPETSEPETTEKDTDELETSEPETTEEETVMPEIEQRYFIYRIWNFNMLTLDQFKFIADTVVQDGFNAIKVHIPWYQAEKTIGKYDFSAFDEMIDYAVKDKGLKVAISIDLTRKSDDGYLTDEELMRDSSGNISAGGYPFDRTQMSLNSTTATYKAVRFYKSAVAHYDKLYGENILFYLPAFSQYAETEIWCTTDYDYSDSAKSAFGKFLETEYGTIEGLNTVIGTSYTSFSEINPPSATASDNLGQLWYIFRHNSLKSLIDRLADAQKKEAPNTKFALQFGCVYDEAAFRRVTLGFTDLCEKADVVWVDDGPTMNHLFSMDLLTSNLPAHVELAQEIDGPTQVGASRENYLAQGMLSFKRGATYVSIANWSIESGIDNYNNYRDIWKQIADRWLSEDAPEVARPDESSPVLDISLSSLFKMHNISSIISNYTSLASTGKPVRINWIDDLTNDIPRTASKTHSFPGGFSSVQGEGGWYYKTYSSGSFKDMTYDQARNCWVGEYDYNIIGTGSMHPDAEDTALIFKADTDGSLVISLNVVMIGYGDSADGILFTVLVNQKPSDILRAEVIYELPLSRTLTVDVKAGDEIAFIINRNSSSAHDSTALSVFIEEK